MASEHFETSSDRRIGRNRRLAQLSFNTPRNRRSGAARGNTRATGLAIDRGETQFGNSDCGSRLAAVGALTEVHDLSAGGGDVLSPFFEFSSMEITAPWSPIRLLNSNEVCSFDCLASGGSQVGDDIRTELVDGNATSPTERDTKGITSGLPEISGRVPSTMPAAEIEVEHSFFVWLELTLVIKLILSQSLQHGGAPCVPMVFAQ